MVVSGPLSGELGVARNINSNQHSAVAMMPVFAARCGCGGAGCCSRRGCCAHCRPPAAPAPTVAVRQQQAQFLFNFMASFLNCEAIVTYRNAIGDVRITIYKAFHNYKG